MKKRLAIFDLDGTLFDTCNVNYLSYKQALGKYGYDIDYDFFCKECNGRHYKEFLVQIGVNDSRVIEDIHNIKKELYEENLGQAIPNRHLFNIIDTIKDGYYTAIVTTASRKNCIEILEYFNKVDIFDLVLTHEDVEKVKPNPEGFLKAMQYFNVEAQETIIFEDSSVGISAAKATNAYVLKVEQFS